MAALGWGGSGSMTTVGQRHRRAATGSDWDAVLVANVAPAVATSAPIGSLHLAETGARIERGATGLVLALNAAILNEAFDGRAVRHALVTVDLPAEVAPLGAECSLVIGADQGWSISTIETAAGLSVMLHYDGQLGHGGTAGMRAHLGLDGVDGVRGARLVYTATVVGDDVREGEPVALTSVTVD